MKNNKGFTMVELLAVIVILGILVAIAIPVYINISKHTKEEEYNAKKNYISEAAVRFAEENGVFIGSESTDTSNKFTAVKLITTGYMSAEKYVNDFPWIDNPLPGKKDDNLVCQRRMLIIK